MTVRIPEDNPFVHNSSADDAYVFICPSCGEEIESSNLTFQDVINAVGNWNGHIESDCPECGALVEIVDSDKLQCWIAAEWDCYNLGIDPDDVEGINDTCRVDILDGEVMVFDNYIESREGV